jgi:D-alanine-D-alanine ligase
LAPWWSRPGQERPERSIEHAPRVATVRSPPACSPIPNNAIGSRSERAARVTTARASRRSAKVSAPMRVAILYNPRPECDAGALDDAFEEYDEPATIVAIAKALAAMGVEPTPVMADEEFPWRLKHGNFDFVFNIAEGAGRRCREAVPAAICEFLRLPFTGSDALTLATTLDKAVARRIVSPDVPVARAVLVERPGDEIGFAGLSYPVVVKPNDEGSSKGIRRESLCADADAAVERCAWLRDRYACPVLVEEFLPGMEVTVGVRGNGCSASLIGLMEIAPAEDRGEPFLYSLETKRHFRRLVRYHVPPRLQPAQVDEIRSHALNAYRRLGCRDVARIDFRMDAAGRPCFLECNPLPGLNPESSDIVILSRTSRPEHVAAYQCLVQGILRDAARRYRISV